MDSKLYNHISNVGETTSTSMLTLCESKYTLINLNNQPVYYY